MCEEPWTYGCPWCPASVTVVASDEAARKYMQDHLDSHAALGLPAVAA
jgi:hypothetical protein